MIKNEFLADPQTSAFIVWFADIINGSTKLGFIHQTGVDQSLSDAFSRYEWPNKRIDIKTPNGDQSIKAGSDFAANKAVLEHLASGIQGCLQAPCPDDAELADWAQAIMTWGGVYSRRKGNGGNAGWLDGQRASFSTYLRRALNALGGNDDTGHCRMTDLRSNAGTTKIHSLILPNFVIYDSRVAAALAWLVHTWATKQNRGISPHLRFACMRANTSKATGKRRSPDETEFPYFAATGRNHHRHAMWNLRANWVIEAAISLARQGGCDLDWSSRKVEAALFMMGDDLAEAI